MNPRVGITLFAATLALAAARADSAADEAWSNDFLGPSVRLRDGRETLGAVRYWNDLVGVAFTRDVRVEIPPTPLDLDADGKPDTTYSQHVELIGGLLANPDRVGLVPTPHDPRGTPGTYTISTGFLGVREERDPRTGGGTNRFGFNCWLCHATADESGRPRLGTPNTSIDLGLIMATARVLDGAHVIRAPPDGPPLSPDEVIRREGLDRSFRFDRDGDAQVTIAEWRAALQLPTADQTRALLLLAGPGRLDQSVDYRMDSTIPLANLQHHDIETYGRDAFLRRAKAGKPALFNPVSIPSARVGIDVAHYSWSGKDSSMRADAVRFLTEKLRWTPAQLAERIRFPVPERGAVDAERLNRALTLDFRNVATAGRETDVLRGVGWPDLMLTNPDSDTLALVPDEFGSVRLRGLLCAPLAAGSIAPAADDRTDSDRIATGRRLFLEQCCGTIVNQRVVVGREARTPPKLAGIAVLGPLDRSRPPTDRIEVRCATCHTYSPAGSKQPLTGAPPDEFRRCDLCHLDHPDARRPGHFLALDAYMRVENVASVDECVRCHAEHADFGRQVFSNSWLMPFDANDDGITHAGHAADEAAGGIGTDAALNVDTNFALQLRPPDRRPERVYLLSDDLRAVPASPRFSKHGYGWVRVAPLISLRFTAPFLHNGSVPTLAALLDEPAHRPARFAVGRAAQAFTFDTTLPGNANSGHRFGVDWTPAEKRAVVRYLESLP
ncbi:MAG: hypothetical protein AB7Q17_05280 [Phycisphaerae bacterium]